MLSSLLFSSVTLALTSVNATVDKNPVVMNESIVLTVVADDSMDGDSLDTSPLLTDFIVGRNAVSSQTSIVNFSATRTTRWQIVLIPRRTGALTIPPLTVENVQSKAITVKVLNAGSPQANSLGLKGQQDVFITAKLSSKEVYVQQLLTLSIKLHIGVQLQRGSLTEPTLTDANIEQIGKDQESDSIINGKRYRVIERTYAITPQKSGQFIVESPMFSGDMTVQSQRRSNFLSFNETKPINVRGDKLALNVLPIPDSYLTKANNTNNNSAWLPSELLTLHQEWQPQDANFVVGEPITRTITLTAAGLAKAQLPKIIMNAPKGLKIYPDQAELHSNLTKERLVSQKKQNFALVASYAGEFTLPEINIAWWNTVTNKYQQTTLPAQTIIVKPNSDGEGFISPKKEKVSNTSSENKTEIAPSSIALPQSVVKEDKNLQWLFLALWLLTILAWLVHVFWLKKKSSTTSPAITSTTNILASSALKNGSEKHQYLALLAACKQNQAQQALTLLLPWLISSQSSATQIITSLDQALTLITQASFTLAVNNLQTHLYGKSAHLNNAWQGSDLLSAIQQLNKLSIKSNKETIIKINP
ncbi:MAG: BatD family protein [Colwellia sp.]